MKALSWTFSKTQPIHSVILSMDSTPLWSLNSENHLETQLGSTACGAQDQSINLDVCLVTFIVIHLSRGQKSIRDPWHLEAGEEGLQLCISQNKALLQCQFTVLPRSWVLLSSSGLRDSGFWGSFLIDPLSPYLLLIHFKLSDPSSYHHEA